jgi:preprotein translocase subunit SecE
MGVRISLPVQKIRPDQTRKVTKEPPYKHQDMNKISNYFSESFKELTEKVTWPDWSQLQQSTMIVLGATLVITAIVWVMDFIAAGALNFIY